MVAKLVRDDIRLRKVRGASAKAPQVVPEPEIDVNLLIRRAVERPRRSLRRPAAGVGRIAKQHQLRMTVLLTLLLENLRPLLLHVVEYGRNQVRIAILRRSVCMRRCRPHLLRRLRTSASSEESA